MPASRRRPLTSRGRTPAAVAACAAAAILAGCAGPAFRLSSAPYDVSVIDAPAVERRPVEIPPEPARGADCGEDARPLSLAEAVLTALRHNRQIRVVEFDPRIAALQARLADTEFDPALGGGLNWTNAHNQSATAIGSLGDEDGSTRVRSLGLPPAAPDTIGVTKRLRSGGAASVGYGLTYDWTDSEGALVLINPAYRSTVRISVEKPLGRGHGKDVNSLGIAIARTNLSQTKHEFERSVRELVRDVHLAYWNLVGTRMTVEALKTSVSTAEQTVEQLAAKFEIGRSSLPDLAQAVQFAEAQRGELIAAENQLLADEQSLAAVVGYDPEDVRRLTPTDRPLTAAYLPDWEQGVRDAFRGRPELQSQAAAVRLARLGLAGAGDGLRPDVTAFAAGAVGGLGDDAGSSLDVLGEGEFGSWSVGVRWSHPIGRRADRLAHEQARLLLAQARTALKSTEENILRELTLAYRNVRSSYETVRHEHARLKAAEVFSEARHKMYELGVITVEDLIAADHQLSEAQLAARLRLIEYNVAVVGWEYATGRLAGPREASETSASEPPAVGSRAMDLILNPPERPEIPGLPDLPAELQGRGAVEEFLPPGQDALFQTPGRTDDGFALPERE